MSALKRLHLIRHGQTEWNAEGRWQGTLDIHLSAAGIEQAHKLAAHLRTLPIRTIASSDLSRAAVTAQIAGAALGVTPAYDPRWREINLGVLQGLTLAEIKAQHPQEHAGMSQHYLDYVVTGGESRRIMQDRAYAAWRDLVADAPGPEIAIFTHGGLIRVLLLKLLGDTPEVRATRIDNTSISTLETDGETVTAIALGAQPHLDGPTNAGGEAANL